jgi:DNA topoisomerase-2
MIKSTNSDKYQKLEHKEHVLLRPDTYIGSIITETRNMFVVEDPKDLNNIKIVNKPVNFNPGFLKLFDEILTNASDHFIRSGDVKFIKVKVTKDSISVENDGTGIPVEMHTKWKCYIPELIFGHLLAGENFNDNIERTWGGKNGLGSKITNIFSKKFILETCDGKKKYVQVFENNLSKINKPDVTASKKQYTKITFFPDFKRFELDGIDEEIESIIIKRCVDVSVYCSKVKVYYNDVLIPTKNFKSYMEMFVGEKEIFYEKLNDLWEIGVSSSLDNSFNQISMVNAISTYVGGTHVNSITNQITKKIQEALLKKNKKLNVKLNDIKNHLFVFVNARVVNPLFDTQAKENLISKVTAPEISDGLLKKLVASTMIEELLKFLMIKEDFDAKKEITKSKIKIGKLDDAAKAGTSESEKCLLFLTEGDSAASSCIAGLSEVDSDYFGIFPLRGSGLNVKRASLADVGKNEEVKNIINILGLEFGKKYTDTKKLRYGKVVLMSDEDADGKHIKGLLMNLFDTFWPELLHLDFIYEFITPIVRIEKGKVYKYFYRLSDYKKWKSETNTKDWFIKYYKGLGTIQPEEMKEFFKKIGKHLIRFHYDKPETKDLIDMLFNDKRADDRKEWLKTYSPVEFIDKFSMKQTYDKFINDEYIEFSMYSNVRQIQNAIDGFKPSQRKAFYTLVKKNIKNEIKVSSLSGAVIETAAYHHGNTSLEGAIVGMAQTFVGVNNINLLSPKGQFGSRLKGGEDSASPRYIFTKLGDVTEYIFRKEDNPVLDYLNDDGMPIEPKYYVPIIPMVLVNGSIGVGTGYSSNVPMYNPLDLIAYIGNKIQNKKIKEVLPFYKGFKGEIILDSDNNRYITRGIFEKPNANVIRISELPIGMWNNKYFEKLDKLVEDKVIKDYVKNCTDTIIDIKLILTRENMQELYKDNNIHKKLSLETYLPITNMHLFDSECKIKKYVDQYDIIDDFMKIRLEYYKRRKEYLLDEFRKDIAIIQNRMKFLKLVIDGTLVINKRSREAVETDLNKFGIDKLEDSYGYLLNMSIMSFTKDRLQDLKEENIRLKEKYKELNETSEEKIWLKELVELKSKIKF